MQEILENAARWYINETGFTLEQMQKDLRGILRHREKAFADGDLERVYRVFAYTEIIKTAICLAKGQEYETSFSRFELGLIKKYSNNGKSTFVCPKCGHEYPAEAFACAKWSKKPAPAVTSTAAAKSSAPPNNRCIFTTERK